MKRFSFEEFNNNNRLLKLKRSKELSVGICLPILNEAKTLCLIIKTLQSCGPLIDDIIAIDSGSTDGSLEICKKSGLRVITDKQAARELGVTLSRGKGFNLWSSLHYLETDIVAWIDTDIKNFSKRFISGIVGPLLVDDKLKFVKGYYKRPKGDARVTEILVRPYTSQIFPEIKDFIQPLSGEYGGRRRFLKSLKYYSGYSVEIAILLQAQFKLAKDEIGQSFLGKRLHELQSVEALGKMSASILRTLLELSVEYGRIQYSPTEGANFLHRFIRVNNEDFHPEKLNIQDLLLPPL